MTAALLLFALVAPLPAAGQSAETCIAYMEADDAFRQAMQQAELYPDYQAAIRRAERTARQSKEALERYKEALRRAERKLSNDNLRSAKRAEEVARAAHSFHADTIQSLELVEAKLFAALEPASDDKADAYAAAYKGPRSDNPRVMAALLQADRKRCRARGM